MTAKLLDVIIGQPTTETMNKMVEQMAQMVAPVKTTAWGGRHGSGVWGQLGQGGGIHWP